MAEHQLSGQVGEFASYLDALLARLDPRAGWSGVFWQRDPEGMRACLDGREVPPWDVVEALLEDIGAAYGPAAAAAERERARTLHAAALTAYDARPGAPDALADRLDVMLREQRYAAERRAGLTRLLSAPVSEEEAASLRHELAWAQDDHTRATARCAELRARLRRLDREGGPGGTGSGTGEGRYAGSPGVPGAPAEPPAGAARPRRPRPDGPAASTAPSAPDAGARPRPPAPEPSAPAAGAPGAPRKRRRGSARFAGAAEDGQAAPVVVPRVPAAGAAEAGAGRRTPRGARFAGVEEPAAPVPAPVAAVDEETAAAVAGVVERLARLRAGGRSGEAHVLLVEAAWWPVARLPPLADALHRAGLGADWATLLWEAAALPAERLVAAADALFAAGRDDDGRQMLRQGVARPAQQLGAAVLRLDEEGREREARALLDACVRVRTPEEAARCVAADPGRLVPPLLRAARAVSEERYWDLVHALRVAGHTL
ncbi:hypothetical protein GCM10018980_22090 [Streptomyces capoamus]|uniref:UL36 very large tegument protein n=1 Tax=Streptomyces capoamus TaxID=68183 RepID=A0A919EWJ7_9ACTN|nr:hypothetical protein [Streptomyces capoamus]GGW09461.1 hypothetical protein GCM10010501_01800 [Streptomyces libani subsp. rufus]GHG44330.1 hypothetical protein GCM10018980_22090 [Streptomyces capoamus]